MKQVRLFLWQTGEVKEYPAWRVKIISHLKHIKKNKWFVIMVLSIIKILIVPDVWVAKKQVVSSCENDTFVFR